MICLAPCSHKLGAIKKFLSNFFQKSWRGVERVAPHTALSFVSFSLGLFFQRKAAKRLCYQYLLDAFSFETIGTKEKALQKENAVMRSRRKPPKLILFASGNPYAARASAFEKAGQNFFYRVPVPAKKMPPQLK